MAPYQIFTDATADCSPKWLASLTPVSIVPMRVEIGGQEYTYGPDGTISAQRFYNLQKEGNYASTSQITPIQYFQSFEPTLRAGNDILYLCFSSGMSGTFQSAQVCAEELREEYPERNIVCLDAIQERFPDANVFTADIGPIIGAHTGPGMLALIYWGNNR